MWFSPSASTDAIAPDRRHAADHSSMSAMPPIATKSARSSETSRSADCVAKLFCPSKRVRLIQDQASMRNVDSRIHSLRFDCCIFLFYSLSAMTFATQSALRGRTGMSANLPLLGAKRSLDWSPSESSNTNYEHEGASTSFRHGHHDRVEPSRDMGPNSKPL